MIGNARSSASVTIGGRIKRLSELEIERKTLLMEGVLAVQAGSQPRLLGERLRAMIPSGKPASADKPGKSPKAGKADKNDVAAA